MISGSIRRSSNASTSWCRRGPTSTPQMRATTIPGSSPGLVAGAPPANPRTPPGYCLPMANLPPVAAPPEVAATAKQLAGRDPVMGAFIAKAGPVTLRTGVGDYFGALVRAIMYQQVAGKAAAAIHGRFVEALGGEVPPERVLATDPEKLRAAGLSGAKLAAVLDLALKSTDG